MTRDDVLDALGADVRLGAAALLGAHLVKGELRARIVETEAYRGLDDPGSHAHRGPTPRNRVMFGPAGFAYVYFTYGMHWMLNVAAEAEGIGAAVLIRAAEPIDGWESMRTRRPKARGDHELLSGPAKICAAYAIDSESYGLDLFQGGDMRIEPGEAPPALLHGPRIGLAEGKGERHLWRFVDAERLRWISAAKTELRPLAGSPADIRPA